MKKFNQTIKIEVSVDAIASNLRNKFDHTFPHAELLTEAIIASALDKNTISHVYNAMNGFNVGIDFEIDELVYCTEEVYVNPGYGALGAAKVKSINQYAENNVEIEHVSGNNTTTRWVKHTKLDKPSSLQLITFNEQYAKLQTEEPAISVTKD